MWMHHSSGCPEALQYVEPFVIKLSAENFTVRWNIVLISPHFPEPVYIYTE